MTGKAKTWRVSVNSEDASRMRKEALAIQAVITAMLDNVIEADDDDEIQTVDRWVFVLDNAAERLAVMGRMAEDKEVASLYEKISLSSFELYMTSGRLFKVTPQNHCYSQGCDHPIDATFTMQLKEESDPENENENEPESEPIKVGLCRNHLAQANHIIRMAGAKTLSRVETDEGISVSFGMGR